jgi:hypothetical protein
VDIGDPMAIDLDEDDGDDDYFTKAHHDQIERVKALRNQSRKLEGHDYVPFDESTSGGVFGKDQIHAVNNRMSDLEAHMLQQQLLKEQYQTLNERTQGSKSSGLHGLIRGGVKDLDTDIYHDELMSENEDEEEREEVEAFIKQRVK